LDKKTETQLANNIKKQFGKSLTQYGYKRTKPTFYTRLKDDRIEFIHLHKFTFGPKFRAHIGVRMFNDTFEAISLNGPDSDSFRRDYCLSYSEETIEIDKCVKELMRFYADIGEPWFSNKENYFIIRNKVGIDTTSSSDDYLLQSYKLLGIKNQV